MAVVPCISQVGSCRTHTVRLHKHHPKTFQPNGHSIKPAPILGQCRFSEFLDTLEEPLPFRKQTQYIPSLAWFGRTAVRVTDHIIEELTRNNEAAPSDEEPYRLMMLALCQYPLGALSRVRTVKYLIRV
jgi:hypothetical protein